MPMPASALPLRHYDDMSPLCCCRYYAAATLIRLLTLLPAFATMAYAVDALLMRYARRDTPCHGELSPLFRLRYYC